MEILGTHAFTTSATRSELDAWVDSVGITVTSVIDAEGLNHQSMDALEVREALAIVELPSMTVVYYDMGDVTGTTEPSIVAGLTKLYELMGQATP